MARPYILGLTGSIGMGKSAVAAMFAEAGVPVFDADATVRALQGPNGVLLPAIESAFPGTTGAQGVDRAALGAAVFGHPEALARLEAIMHPAVAAERQRFLATHADAPLVVLDIPLLFEKTGRAGMDGVAVVSAPESVQRARVLARAGMSEEKFAAIRALQWSDRQKREAADYLIDTNCALDATKASVLKLIARLGGAGEGGKGKDE
ncbi:dephospho-CoA kinase [Novosphingobium umbonatum]|uniref:Dephospho-CoA kinase n=1 Tax=Novosphingobium umbonatum TaxID=1908524 RepID=A0A3S2UU43_9SPHN|nr:dephospho-CoA kinase [Novosphingobium umbonatum]RVU05026.1 dephospho-CoA kinase [Novosphingobium umbonatum]